MVKPLKYSVLIPAFNSERSIVILLDSLRHFFDTVGELYEIIVMDDASLDNTAEVVEKYASQHAEVSVWRLKYNRGQQMALYLGLRHCRGDFVITMDDDLQHAVTALPELLVEAERGADLVFGIYSDRTDQHYRRQGSYWIGRFFKWRFKEALGELRVSSYRVIARSVYTPVAAMGEKRFVYLSAELIPFARRIANVEVVRSPRAFGKSGYRFWRLLGIGIRLCFYYGFCEKANGFCGKAKSESRHV
ncbi:MAG: polyisoprenyl-phosphate glycosyltransferase [Clostridiales bacterium]|jgi:glycosyltransferase involved in cell wall biosynthesis|nr:polyisoprenyl-phosphate glycosyltransferase [Clostridiales bacterium]MDN5299266.1 polyisoprenyl-phosphate glycosyltransferase [Clostridiales bacterium]